MLFNQGNLVSTKMLLSKRAKRISDVLYRIQMTDNSKPKVVHFDRLKPYTGTDPPTWLSPATTKEQRNPRYRQTRQFVHQCIKHIPDHGVLQSHPL